MDELNELTKLLISVIAPLLLVFPTVTYQYIHRHKDRKDWSYFKFCRSFDANHGLGSQPWFSMAIVYPVGLFFSTGYWAWSGLNLKISADGFKLFIEVSKLPLGLLALSIPLAALTARLHGTKQTALQIKVVGQKNISDLYIAHYNHFCNHIEMLEMNYRSEQSEGRSLSFNKKLLYKQLYPDSTLTSGVSDLSFNLFNRVSNRIENLYDFLEDTSVKKVTQAEEKFTSLNLYIELTLHEMAIMAPKEFLKSEFEISKYRDTETCISNDNDLIHFVDLLCGTVEYIYEFHTNLSIDKLDALRMNLVPGAIPNNVAGKIIKWRELILFPTVTRRTKNASTSVSQL